MNSRTFQVCMFLDLVYPSFFVMVDTSIAFEVSCIQSRGVTGGILSVHSATQKLNKCLCPLEIELLCIKDSRQRPCILTVSELLCSSVHFTTSQVLGDGQPDNLVWMMHS